MKILIGYDGSADAQAAIETAGVLFAGHEATILTIWEGLSEVMARTGGGLGAASLDFEAADRDSTKVARARADEGSALARAAGLDAHPLTAKQDLTVWSTIIAQADTMDADAIVLGSRGLGRMKSLLLGSVSHAVLQHADRPVLVVPSDQVAGKRAERRQDRVAGQNR